MMSVLIMCIGNRDNGDDGIGPYIADIFPETKGFTAVDCGVVPESFTHLSRDAERIILIDAVDMELEPGEIRIVPKDRIPTGSVSTHNIPLSMLMEYLEMEGKSVILVGIQPKKLRGELTRQVREAGKKLIKVIVENRLDELEVLK